MRVSPSFYVGRRARRACAGCTFHIAFFVCQYTCCVPPRAPRPRRAAVNLEPLSARQEISEARELNPYKFVSPIYWKSARFCPDRAEGRSRPPALYRSRLEQEAEAPPKRRASSFCSDRERAWARFLTLRPAVSSIFCETRGWWLSVGALRNTSRHVDTLSVCVIEFNGWAQAHPDTIRTPSVH